MERKFNNWPESSKLKVKPLGKDEVAIYRLLNTYDPKSKKYSLRTQFIATKATVSDPESNQLYEAAYVTSWMPNGDGQLGEISFDPSRMCMIQLRGSSVEDQKKYQFMEISNENLSNPNRDSNITPYFERIQSDSDSTSQRDERKKRQKALNIVETMSNEDIAAYFRAHNLPSAGSAEDKRNRIEEIAENDPDKFLLGTNGIGIGDISLDVENFVQNQVIRYDRVQAVWFWHHGKILLKLQKSFSADPKMELVKFLQRNGNKREELQLELDRVQAARTKTVKPTLPTKAKAKEEGSDE